MVLVQKWPLFQLFFFQIQARKMSFTIFENEETPFQAIKTKSSKSRKIDIFPKRLTHGFGPKIGHFSNFSFLGNIRQENDFYNILEPKIAFLDCKKNKFKKSVNGYFSKVVNPLFWSKNGHFSNFFFQPIQARKMSFTIF